MFLSFDIYAQEIPKNSNAYYLDGNKTGVWTILYDLDWNVIESIDSAKFYRVISTLLEWHRNDPVDEWEENRNNIIYNSYQNNRNPFIDFPKLAEHIWGTEIGVNWTGDDALGINSLKETSLVIYRNLTSKIIKIKWINTKAQVMIYDLLGRKVLESEIDTDNNTVDVSKLKGIHIVNLITQYKTITKLIIYL